MKQDKAAEQDVQIPEFSTEQLAVVYSVETIVNNLPEEHDKLMNQAFQCQAEYANETDFRTAFLLEAIKGRAKYIASGAVTAWETAVDRYTRLHTKLSREECIEQMLKMQSNRQLQELATVGGVVKIELK